MGGTTVVAEVELLGKHGVMLPPNMVGLTEEQVRELKLKDEFEDVCIPSGGSVFSEDPVGRRTGKGGRRASVAGCTCCLAWVWFILPSACQMGIIHAIRFKSAISFFQFYI